MFLVQGVVSFCSEAFECVFRVLRMASYTVRGLGAWDLQWLLTTQGLRARGFAPAIFRTATAMKWEFRRIGPMCTCCEQRMDERKRTWEIQLTLVVGPRVVSRELRNGPLQSVAPVQPQKFQHIFKCSLQKPARVQFAVMGEINPCTILADAIGSTRVVGKLQAKCGGKFLV